MISEEDEQKREKYIGLGLALASSFLIGSSFILTKLGLNASQSVGALKAGDSYSYLKNAVWWAGMVTMILGEITNFAAYSFAPAILVTPLGAGSVVVSAILASFFLGEVLNRDGKIGCALCIIGAVIIVLHSPPEETISSTSQVLSYALRPVYLAIVVAASIVLVYKVAPIYGRSHMVVYVSICSLVGSISVMACKGFGIAVKLTSEGDNQFNSPAAYIFGVTVVFCAITQINYFNKALDLFSTNLVTPVYYVMFTTATILASIILFEGIDKATPIEIVSVFVGFLIILIGVFMVNSAKSEATYHSALNTPSLSAAQSEIPLKFIGRSENTREGSTQYLRSAEISNNQNFIIEEESETIGKLSVP